MTLPRKSRGYDFPVWLMFLIGVTGMGGLYTATCVMTHHRRPRKSKLCT